MGLPGPYLIAAPSAPPPDLFDADGHMRLLPCAALDAIPPDALRVWCHVHARYGLVNAELVAWLGELIDGRKAIEIGSGAGDFAHHLGIPGTDSKVQDRPNVRAFYAATGQPTVRYPASVRKIDALDAVRKLKPAVVFGSWITHWINPQLPPPPGGGSQYGVKEDKILAEGVTYVMLGNLAVHQHKPILQRPHDALVLPFLRSRAREPQLDRLFVWWGKQ